METIIDVLKDSKDYNFETYTGDCESSIIVTDKNKKEFRIIVREESWFKNLSTWRFLTEYGKFP